MRRLAILVPVLAALTALAGGVPAHSAGIDPSKGGSFAAPFEEPGPRCVTTADGKQVCKPAGSASIVLANGRILYWNNLEGTENIKLNTVAEAGNAAENSQSRVLTLGSAGPSWSTPSPSDGGAKDQAQYLIPGVTGSAAQDPNHGNDGDLFCSDQVQLADGSILDTGGTNWYEEPQLPGGQFGVAELQGVKEARIFHPDSQTWTPTGSMNFGRWYPALVTLPDGKVFVASGVTKLLKPIYPDRPGDSGTNVEQTETYDPATGKWSDNGAAAKRALPLFPRLHLLPDGKVYYDAAGQVFNPFGQAYDEALWNVAGVYDPGAKAWKDLGIPGIGTAAPGFRGSTFSIMLPLSPPYTSASFLTAGGELFPTPGSYFALPFSTINTVDTAKGDALSTKQTGNLAEGRWYSTAVQLPDGTVAAFSGADRDEVESPGTEIPVKTPEIFDPETNTWTPAAGQSHPRSYHNTAVLLPDGRVLVGGHAPIPTLYTKNLDLPGPFTPNHRDPSFEIFSPPYLFRGPRPTITHADDSIAYGRDITVATPDAADIDHAVLVRNTALTHLVDGDQRSVILPVTHRSNGEIKVAAPPNAAVAPAGPYMLFLDRKNDKGQMVPSVAAQVFVGAPVPAWVEASAGRPATVLGTSQVRPDPAPHAVPAPASAPAASLAETGRESDLPKGVVLLAAGAVGVMWRRRVRGRARGPG
ncbi:MAG: DUF1929 domain-containing protein [Acidimicrobiia bacterium]|nr:DUF1929 domain-containing protein [Acidimicrobiia bacterium]